MRPVVIWEEKDGAIFANVFISVVYEHQSQLIVQYDKVFENCVQAYANGTHLFTTVSTERDYKHGLRN
jgi:hypothetical protein